MQSPIYHLALIEDWERDPGDNYATSTLGRSLEEVGFIHCSFHEQVRKIADLVYGGRTDVLLLEIDPSRLAAEVRVDEVDGGAFPHIYGSLNRDAVVKITPLSEARL